MLARRYKAPKYKRPRRAVSPSVVAGGGGAGAIPSIPSGTPGIAVIAQSERDPAKIVFTVRQLCEGRSNATGTFTLTANAASTTISCNCGAGSSIICFPTSSNAAAELGNGTIYLSAVSAKSFTMVHANNAQTNRNFVYVAIG